MPPSLCHTCVHCQTVVSGKGSQFWLCRKSLEDRQFAKYPPQPVQRCTGFAQRPVERAGSEGA